MFNRNAPPPDGDMNEQPEMPKLQPERTYKVRWTGGPELVLTCRRIEQVGSLIVFTNVVNRDGTYDIFLVRAIPVSSIVDYEEVMLHGMSIAQSSALVVG